MKEFLKALASAIYMVLAFVIVFLFAGNPKFWDMLHSIAMGVCK